MSGEKERRKLRETAEAKEAELAADAQKKSRIAPKKKKEAA